MFSTTDTLNVDQSTIRRIRNFTDQVDEITVAAVEAVVTRDYDAIIEVRALFAELGDCEGHILADLPKMNNDDLLEVREVLVPLQQTAQYARNAENAANLVLNAQFTHTTIN